MRKALPLTPQQAHLTLGDIVTPARATKEARRFVGEIVGIRFPKPKHPALDVISVSNNGLRLAWCRMDLRLADEEERERFYQENPRHRMPF